MQFFCLKLHPLIGLEGRAGLRASGSSGSWTVGGIKSAGAAEANGVGSKMNLLSFTCELLRGSPTLSDNSPSSWEAATHSEGNWAQRSDVTCWRSRVESGLVLLFFLILILNQELSFVLLWLFRELVHQQQHNLCSIFSLSKSVCFEGCMQCRQGLLLSLHLPISHLFWLLSIYIPSTLHWG